MFLSTFLLLAITDQNPLWLANQKAAETAYEEKIKFLESEERMMLLMLKDYEVPKWHWNCQGQQEVLDILVKTGYIKENGEFWKLNKKNH